MVITLLVTLSSPTLPLTLYTYLGIDLGLLNPNATDTSPPPPPKPESQLQQEDLPATSRSRPLIDISHRWFYLCSGLAFFVLSALLLFVPERDRAQPTSGDHANLSRHKAKSSTTDESELRTNTSSQSSSSGATRSEGRCASATGLRAIPPPKESDSDADDTVELSPAPVGRKPRRRFDADTSRLRLLMPASANRHLIVRPGLLPSPTSLAPLISAGDEEETKDDRAEFFPPSSPPAPSGNAPTAGGHTFSNRGRPEFLKSPHTTSGLTTPPAAADSPL